MDMSVVYQVLAGAGSLLARGALSAAGKDAYEAIKRIASEGGEVSHINLDSALTDRNSEEKEQLASNVVALAHEISKQPELVEVSHVSAANVIIGDIDGFKTVIVTHVESEGDFKLTGIKRGN